MRKCECGTELLPIQQRYCTACGPQAKKDSATEKRLAQEAETTAKREAEPSWKRKDWSRPIPKGRRPPADPWTS